MGTNNFNITFEHIEVRKQDGTPVTYSAHGKNVPLAHRQWDKVKSWSWIGTARPYVIALMNELPIYYRGKLKGDMQISKSGDILTLSESYYNSILANEGPQRIDCDYRTLDTFHFPGHEFIYLTVEAKIPNLIAIYNRIEDSFCDSRHSVGGFKAYERIAKDYEAFKAFKNSKVWDVSFEPTGYQDEQTSFNVKIGENWHFVTRFQAWEMEKLKPLVTRKTKEIHLITTIDETIRRLEKQRLAIACTGERDIEL